MCLSSECVCLCCDFGFYEVLICIYGFLIVLSYLYMLCCVCVYILRWAVCV